MIEDVDICSCFQDLADEPPFGQEDHKEYSNGDDEGKTVPRPYTLHSIQIQMFQLYVENSGKLSLFQTLIIALWRDY